jgi:hypothetical protein
LNLFTNVKDFLITDLQDYPNPTVPPQNVKLYLLYAYTWGRGRGGRNNLLKMLLNPFLYIHGMRKKQKFLDFLLNYLLSLAVRVEKLTAALKAIGEGNLDRQSITVYSKVKS